MANNSTGEPTGNDGTTASFGFEDVPRDERQGMVNRVFSSVAERYDLMNDLMSAGMHRIWKEDLVTQINPPKSDAMFRLLDVAGGTGDIAMRTMKRGGLARSASKIRRVASVVVWSSISTRTNWSRSAQNAMISGPGRSTPR